MRARRVRCPKCGSYNTWTGGKQNSHCAACDYAWEATR